MVKSVVHIPTRETTAQLSDSDLNTIDRIVYVGTCIEPDTARHFFPHSSNKKIHVVASAGTPGFEVYGLILVHRHPQHKSTVLCRIEPLRPYPRICLVIRLRFHEELFVYRCLRLPTDRLASCCQTPMFMVIRQPRPVNPHGPGLSLAVEPPVLLKSDTMHEHSPEISVRLNRLQSATEKSILRIRMSNPSDGIWTELAIVRLVAFRDR